MNEKSTRIGVRNFYYKPIIKDDETGVTYGEPKRIYGLREVTLTPQTAEGDLYADDGLYEYTASVTGFDITIGLADIPFEDRSEMLGYPIDEDGVLTVTSNSMAPWFGVTFEAERSNGSYDYLQVHKVRFAPMEESFETKSDSVNFQTPSITGKSAKTEAFDSFYDVVRSNEKNKKRIEKWHESTEIKPKAASSTGGSEG